MAHRLVSLCCLSLLFAWDTASKAQTAVPTVEFTIGVGQPVANVGLPLYIFISNPARTPIPTGTVTVSFGDGQTETDPLTRGLAIVKHTYTTAGPVTINAAYNGDSVFPAVTTAQSRVVLSTPPAPITLNTFGSSTTAGTGASSLAADYASLTAAAEGWTLANYGIGGTVVSTETPQEYALQVTPQTYSSLLIGTNEIAVIGPSAAASAEYVSALTADYAYLLVANGTPQKVSAQNASVARTGPWATSDVYSAMGLKTQAAGSTLTFSLPGSTLFAGLSTKASDSVFAISVDGVPVGTYQPTTLIGSPEVYGVRLPIAGSALNKTHTLTVTCVTPGANGCYVDFVSSNGATAPMQPPYLWTMSAEDTVQGYPVAWYDNEAAEVKALTSLFASDGFTVAYGDLEYRYTGLSSPDCFASDHLHSVDCGHQMIAATLLAAMDNVESALQRISFAPLPASPAIGSLALQATATSGLPVTFTVDSGSATIQAGVLSATGAGSVVITAHQAGNTVFLPAPNVSQTIVFPGADPALTLSIPNHTYNDAPFTLAATTKSNGAIAYAIVSGPATISGTKLTMTGAGTVTVQASQAASAAYASANVSVSFAVAPAVPAITWLPASGTIRGGSALGTGVLDAVSATAGRFAYTATVSGGTPVAVVAATVLVPGTYTLTATLTPSDSVDYLAATSSAALVVQAQHVWIANANGSVSVLDNAGRSAASTTPAGGVAVAVDNAGSVWSLNPSGTSLVKLNASGPSAVSVYSGGGLSGATALAIDGGGQVWIANTANTVSSFSNAGKPLTPAAGYSGGGMSKPSGVAIDISGNVWIANSGNNSVTEILGGAVPVMPLANAVATNSLAVKP